MEPVTASLLPWWSPNPTYIMHGEHAFWTLIFHLLTDLQGWSQHSVHDQLLLLGGSSGSNQSVYTSYTLNTLSNLPRKQISPPESHVLCPTGPRWPVFPQESSLMPGSALSMIPREETQYTLVCSQGFQLPRTPAVESAFVFFQNFSK